MKSDSKEKPKKGKSVQADDDTLGENTEQTRVAKEAKKDQQNKKTKDKPGKKG